MSPLDRAVYLADSLEPNRRFPERAQLWEIALRDLEEATSETLRVTAQRRAEKEAFAEARASAS
jgi:HD superfamily phosphohydrolase YqeK